MALSEYEYFGVSPPLPVPLTSIRAPGGQLRPDQLGSHASGWTIYADTHDGLIREFRAEHPLWGSVWGELAYLVHAEKGIRAWLAFQAAMGLEPQPSSNP